MRIKGFVPIILLIIIASFGIGVVVISKKTTKSGSQMTEPSPFSMSETPLPSDSLSPIESDDSGKTASFKPTLLNTPLPTSAVTLDINLLGLSETDVRFGYNKGDGLGWITEKSYRASENVVFSEVSKYWSSTVSVCFKFSTNESLNGKSVDYSIYHDNQKLGSSSLTSNTYCTDLGSNVGKHKVVFVLNAEKKIKETNYNNNSLEVSYELKADSTAPNFTIYGPNKESAGTCVYINDVSDNVSTYSDLIIEDKMNSDPYSTYHYPKYCVNGTPGENHTYSVRIRDIRGNVTEKSKNFSIL